MAGVSVSDAGDVDGDGHDDLLVGALSNDEGGPNAGAAYLVHGPISGVTYLAGFTKLIGEADVDFAGFSISGAGDNNGDGYHDFLVGAYANDEGGEDAGAAYLVHGDLTYTANLADADAKLVGEAAGDWAGYSVSGAGDVDGDGLGDFLVGTYINAEGGIDAGAVYLLYGPATGTIDLTNADVKLVGIGGDWAGYSASGAGDVDGDGLGDVIVGAKGSGAAYLVTGYSASM